MSEAQVLLKHASPAMTFLTTVTIKWPDPEYGLSYLTVIKSGNYDSLYSTKKPQTYSAVVKGELS